MTLSPEAAVAVGEAGVAAAISLADLSTAAAIGMGGGHGGGIGGGHFGGMGGGGHFGDGGHFAGGPFHGGRDRDFDDRHGRRLGFAPFFGDYGYYDSDCWRWTQYRRRVWVCD
jgi:hypothetical protein